MATVTAIFSAILLMGALGFVFGAILSYASQKFAVTVDPRIETAISLLPGANCGGCGFPGCAGLATAIVEKGVPIATCPVLTAAARAKLSLALGLADAGPTTPLVATVMCNGLPAEEYRKFEYTGIVDCQAAVLVANGPWLCPHRCVGLGSCVKACPFGAMTLGENRLPIIDKEKCTACGKCVKACPKAIIKLVDKEKTVHVKCNSPEKGPDVRKVCKVGCIGCQLCKKVCAYDAIIIENNLARIDYSKCVQCGACVAKCPQKTIIMQGVPDFKARKAFIDEPACVGCTLCFKVCKFQAVEGGTPKEKHRIISAKCVGCGACVAKCPKKCIILKPID